MVQDRTRARLTVLGWVVVALVLLALAGAVAASVLWPDTVRQVASETLGLKIPGTEPQRYIVRRDGAVVTVYPVASDESSAVVALEDARLAALAAADAKSGFPQAAAYVVAEIDNTAGSQPQTVDEVVVTNDAGADVAYVPVHLRINDWMHVFVGVDGTQFARAQGLLNVHAGDRTAPPGEKRTVLLIAAEPPPSPVAVSVDGVEAQPSR